MKKYIVLGLTLAILNACGSNEKQNESPNQVLGLNSVELTEAQFKNSNIETGKIQEKGISTLLKVNGSIDVPPQNMVSISVPMGGFLKSSKLLPGMYVSKGETIAIIEDQAYISLQEEYLSAQATIEYTEEEYLRQTELNKSKAVSDKVFQQAKAAYTSQKITIKALSEKLKLIGINPTKLTISNMSRSISIPSPINGYVSKVNVNIGKYVNPADILFELVNPDDIHLALNIFEKDINKLYVGQTVIAYTNSETDLKHPCKIILIGKNLNHDRSVVVHCHFDKYDKTLIPGMFMNAEIETQSHHGFVIPTEAIVRFEGTQYVFAVKKNKKYEMQEVTVQNSENGFTQITFKDKKDKSNSLFVLKGAYTLLMKLKNIDEE